MRAFLFLSQCLLSFEFFSSDKGYTGQIVQRILSYQKRSLQEHSIISSKERKICCFITSRKDVYYEGNKKRFEV